MELLSKRLKEARISKGYSLQELADKSNTSKSAINMYERGERRPKYEALASISRALNINIDYFLGKTDNPAENSFRIGNKYNANVAHNIQFHRESAGLSQEEFAKILGINEDDVDALESGLYKLNKDMLYKICDALSLIPQDIIPHDSDDFDENADYVARGPQNVKKPSATEDEELSEYLEKLRVDENYRMMFSLMDGASKEDVAKAVQVVKALLGEN